MPYRHMSLKELAKHIGMDAREIEQMARKGHLPGQLVGGEWRFHSAQMLDWLQREMHSLGRANIVNLERAMASSEHDTTLIDSLLAPEGVEMQSPAKSRASVLRKLVDLVERTGLLWSRQDLLGALEEREELCSTALAGGFAFPHPRRPLEYATAESLVCLVRVPKGIPFGAPDGDLTDIFALVCCHDERLHLQVLARLSLLFHSELPDRLRDIEDPAEAIAAVVETERTLLAGRK